MKRSILFVLALTLIGSSALAQGLPSSPPTAGSATGVAPSGVYGTYGTSSGVQYIEDPYGTRAAATRFGTPAGVVSPQTPYGTGSAAQQPR